jgi:UDP-N-acetylglucosamine 4-epimerase
VQANILAALTNKSEAVNQVYNVACGSRITLNELFIAIATVLDSKNTVKPRYLDLRSGDIRHSLADISKISTNLGYKVLYQVQDGLKEVIEWYINFVPR